MQATRTAEPGGSFPVCSLCGVRLSFFISTSNWQQQQEEGIRKEAALRCPSAGPVYCGKVTASSHHICPSAAFNTLPLSPLASLCSLGHPGLRLCGHYQAAAHAD